MIFPECARAFVNVKFSLMYTLYLCFSVTAYFVSGMSLRRYLKRKNGLPDPNRSLSESIECRATVEPLKEDPPRKGHCIKYLSTMDKNESPNLSLPINIM